MKVVRWICSIGVGYLIVTSTCCIRLFLNLMGGTGKDGLLPKALCIDIVLHAALLGFSGKVLSLPCLLSVYSRAIC